MADMEMDTPTRLTCSNLPNTARKARNPDVVAAIVSRTFPPDQASLQQGAKQLALSAPPSSCAVDAKAQPHNHSRENGDFVVPTSLCLSSASTDMRSSGTSSTSGSVVGELLVRASRLRRERNAALQRVQELKRELQQATDVGHVASTAALSQAALQATCESAAMGTRATMHKLVDEGSTRVMTQIIQSSKMALEHHDAISNDHASQLGQLREAIGETGDVVKACVHTTSEAAASGIKSSMQELGLALGVAVEEARGARAAADRVGSALDSLVGRAIQCAAHELGVAQPPLRHETGVNREATQTTDFADALLRKTVTFDDQVREVEDKVMQSSLARARAVAKHGGSGITDVNEQDRDGDEDVVHSLMQAARSEPTAAALAVEVESLSDSAEEELLGDAAGKVRPGDRLTPVLRPARQDGLVGSLLVAAMTASQPELARSLATKAMEAASCRHAQEQAEVSRNCNANVGGSTLAKYHCISECVLGKVGLCCRVRRNHSGWRGQSALRFKPRRKL